MILENKDRINIKDLIIPEPKPEGRVFDFEELVDRAWPMVLDKLQELKNPSRINRFLQTAAYCLLLRPGCRKDLGLDSEISALIKKGLENEENIHITAPRNAFAAKILSSGFSMFNTEVTTAVVHSIERSDTFFWDFLSSACIADQFPPEMAEQQFGKLLIRYENLDQSDTFMLLDCASSLRVMHPELFDRSSVGDELLKAIRNELDKALSNKDVEEFSEIAACYKIVTAKSVKRVETGLEIEMPKKMSLHQLTPPQPETRRF